VVYEDGEAGVETNKRKKKKKTLDFLTRNTTANHDTLKYCTLFPDRNTSQQNFPIISFFSTLYVY
jgi:hypothetical protein